MYTRRIKQEKKKKKKTVNGWFGLENDRFQLFMTCFYYFSCTFNFFVIFFFFPFQCSSSSVHSLSIYVIFFFCSVRRTSYSVHIECSRSRFKAHTHFGRKLSLFISSQNKKYIMNEQRDQNNLFGKQHTKRFQCDSQFSVELASL